MCLSTTCTKNYKGEREKLRLKCLWAKLGVLWCGPLRSDSALSISGLPAVLLRTPGTSGASQLSMH